MVLLAAHLTNETELSELVACRLIGDVVFDDEFLKTGRTILSICPTRLVRKHPWVRRARAQDLGRQTALWDECRRSATKQQ